ncbi:microcin C transport system substrate-binding protein [Ketogulonicigenium robustum]|uniref:Microcin C transport system substrate-binding protein n=1 Tax=Ketogulonicigenium robustum TaxID=92947 RepID=A0A1W6NXY1_9RHOB|nr:extracellular solute-binding protein [Ketogulonicigenium robustum]ARO14041.1 microcin C transport system substrate-binding protein [Ketogulonicigenium robustum]
MRQRPRSAAKAIAQRRTDWRSIAWAGALGVFGAVILAGAVKAQDAPTITTHGFTTFGDLSELKYPADFQHLDYVNPDAPKGGTISIWAQGTFDNFNPYSREGRAGALANIGYESLLETTADTVSDAYCLLCATIEYPENQDWVIFHMRPEARFSDGTPLTAHDVVFSHNLLLEQGLPSYASAVGEVILTVEALDDYTVKFTFAPDAPRKGLILQAGAVPVFSQAWYESSGARLDKIQVETSPGSGPYVRDDFSYSSYITYRRNPDYWGADLPINQGRANFDTIRVVYYADSNVAFEAFKAGEYTFRQENSSIVWATGYDFPALNNGYVLKDEMANGSLPPAVGMVMNLRRPQFQDIRVRQAIALMYNFTWTNDTLQYGLFQQRDSFWQGTALEAKGTPEGQELEDLQGVADLIDPAILTDEVTMPHTSGANQLDRGNLRRALALMAEAGWESGPDGKLMKDGQPLRIEFLGYSPMFDRIITPFIENLNTLGIEANYNRIDPAQYTVRTRAMDYDMVYDGYDNGMEEGTGLSQRYGTYAVDDVFNPAGYASPAVDKLIEDAVDAENFDEMAAAVRAIDRIMRHEMFVIPTWYNPNFWVSYFDMFEHPDNMPPYALGQLDFWWYNADKADGLRAAGVIR